MNNIFGTTLFSPVTLRRRLLIAIGFVCLFGHAFAAENDRKFATGQKVINFILPDAAGNQVALSDFGDKQTVVLFTMGLGCPISNLYSYELSKIQKEFEMDGF